MSSQVAPVSYKKCGHFLLGDCYALEFLLSMVSLNGIVFILAICVEYDA